MENCNLQDLAIDDKDLFESFFALEAQRLSDMSFPALYIWNESYEFKWCIVKDCLCLFSLGGGYPSLFFPPLGDGNKQKALHVCKEIFHSSGHPSFHIEIATRSHLSYLSDGEVHARSGDYVYETKNLISLPGGAYSSKRRAIRSFLKKNTEIRFIEYDRQYQSQCAELLQRWKITKSDQSSKDRDKMETEIKSVEKLLNDSNRLDVKGTLLFSGEVLVGFTFGDLLSKDMCNIMVEKTDNNFAGSAQYIFNEFCRQSWRETKWCNVGDDWEVPGIAWVKESYRPAFRIEKFRVKVALI